MADLVPQPSLSPHTSLMRGQHKTTGLHLLLTDSWLASFQVKSQSPHSLPTRTYSRSSLPLITSALAPSLACYSQIHLLLLAQILPKLELQTLSDQSHCVLTPLILGFHPDSHVHPHSAISYHLRTQLQSTCSQVPYCLHRGHTSRDCSLPGASLGSHDQVHSCGLSAVADVSTFSPEFCTSALLSGAAFELPTF